MWKVYFLKHQDFITAFDQAPTAFFKQNKPRFYCAYGKRAFDVVLALIILPVVAPIILILWLMIRVGGGAGCFAHNRVGKNGRMFKCWKLRTMRHGSSDEFEKYLKANSKAAAEWDQNQKLREDTRVTRLGRVLRRRSFDELPQIWNVLKGDMSFVGPRPVVKAELLRYGAREASYLVLRPGITGLWQVSGRNSVSYSRRIALDATYQKRHSFLVDLKILFLTISVVFAGNGY